VCRSVFLALLWCVFAATAFADQVTLKNGDRLTGTIVKFDEEKLLLKTDYAGDVNLQWAAVAGITSAEPLHIVLKSGRIIDGVVTTRDEIFVVRTPNGPEVEAPKAEVAGVRNAAEHDVYLRSLHPRLIDLWSGVLDTGLSLTRGNSDSTSFALSGKAARTTHRNKIGVYTTAIYARSKVAGVSSTTAQAVRGGIRDDFDLRPRLFVFGLADFEHDEFQDLDLRSVLGGGLGYHMIKEKNTNFDVFGGATYNQEYYSQAFNPPNPSTTRKSGEFVAGETFATKISTRTTFSEQFSIFPNLSDTGSYRFQFDATGATKLKSWLSWQLTFSDRFVSRPLLGLKDNDLIFTTGLRLTFGKGVF
jgi:putative salt-induced outer membrane protein YdiY